MSRASRLGWLGVGEWKATELEEIVNMQKKIMIVVIVGILTIVLGIVFFIPQSNKNREEKQQKKEQQLEEQKNNDEELTPEDVLNEENKNQLIEDEDKVKGVTPQMPREEFAIEIEGFNEKIIEETTDEETFRKQVEDYLYDNYWFDCTSLVATGEIVLTSSGEFTTISFFFNGSADVILYSTYDKTENIWNFRTEV